MKDYVKDFQNKVAEFDADAQCLNIINAGVMNHGKSSLLNSLLDRVVFPEQDIRTTVENRAEQWTDNVRLIDTPGLDAAVADDAKAFDAYRRANVILFVHRVDVGELHSAGIDGLNKIKALFPDEKFFVDHLCLVLTVIDDTDSPDSLDAVREKILADVKNFCGLSGFKIFCVSNTRYRKGMEQGKPQLVERSGIPELRSYLQENFRKWFAENQTVRAARIARERDDFIAQLRRERVEVERRIQSKTEQLTQRQKIFLRKVETAVAQRNEDFSRYRSEMNRLDEMKRELRNLRDRWNRERY